MINTTLSRNSEAKYDVGATDEFDVDALSELTLLCPNKSISCHGVENQLVNKVLAAATTMDVFDLCWIVRRQILPTFLPAG